MKQERLVFLGAMSHPNKFFVQMVELIPMPIPIIEFLLRAYNLAPRKQNVLNRVCIKGIIRNNRRLRRKLSDHLLNTIQIKLKHRSKLSPESDSLLCSVVSTLDLCPNNTKRKTQKRSQYSK